MNSSFFRSNIIPIVLIVLIIIIGVVLLTRGDDEPAGIAVNQNQGIPGQQYAGGAVNPGIGQQPGAGTVPGSAPMIVTVTDQGFAPSTLQTRVGQVVTFVNQSSRPVWPASGPHPAHNQYPTQGGCTASTFDACQQIAPGASWSFQFDIAGTWPYHDHLNPAMRGTIAVQ